MTGRDGGRRGTGARPGAAAMATDDESGNEGAEARADAARSLRALEVMRDRGLIGAEEFERRRRALIPGDASG